MLKRFWRPETGVFLGVWLVLLVGGRSRFFRDPGTFWHTVVGEQLLSSCRLIDTDTFSFTFFGRPWIPHQWLGECLMALVHRLDGLDSLLLATVTILSGLYTWVAYRLIRAGLHWSLASLLVALTIGASSMHFHIRPHIATIVFQGCTMAFLCDFEAGRIGWRRLVWLVPLYLLWTNIHGGMLGGLCTMILAVAGWGAARMLGLESPMTSYRHIVLFFLLIFACGLTAFVNPYGWRLPWTWVSIMDSPILPRIIQEHAPLDLAEPSGWIVLLLGVVYLAALLSTWPRWPRVTWLLPLVWFYLACTRVRHAPLFAVTAAMALADVIPHSRIAVRLATAGSDLFQFPDQDKARRFHWGQLLLPLAVLLAVVGLQAGQVPVPVFGHGWAKLDATAWPVELLPELRQYQQNNSSKTPIFNDYVYGGFLIYFTPGYSVFVDDRCELYGDEWLQTYVAAEQGQRTAVCLKEWESTYPRFDLALTQTGYPFDRYFAGAPDWIPVHQTQTATLYRRR